MINQAFGFLERAADHLDDLEQHRTETIARAIALVCEHEDAIAEPSPISRENVVVHSSNESVPETTEESSNIVRLDAARQQVSEAYPEVLAA